MRAALGASRGRIVRQLVIESLVLSAGGGARGLLIAYWATQALVTLDRRRVDGGDSRRRLASTRAACSSRSRRRPRRRWRSAWCPAREASQVDPQAALRDRRSRRHSRPPASSCAAAARRHRGGARRRAAGRRGPAAAHALESRTRRSGLSVRQRRSRWDCFSACARRRPGATCSSGSSIASKACQG